MVQYFLLVNYNRDSFMELFFYNIRMSFGQVFDLEFYMYYVRIYLKIIDRNYVTVSTQIMIKITENFG